MIIPKDTLDSDALAQRLLDWASHSSQYPYFKGSPEDLADWLLLVDRACEEIGIHETQTTDVAVFFISGDLAHVMKERQLKYLEKSGDKYWSWDDFKRDIEQVITEAERILAEESSNKLNGVADAISRFREEHPYIAASASTGLMVGGVLVLLPALGILALNAIGFTSGGVAAGSLAAALQSIFYGGATGGVFSFFQALGATAVMPALGTVFTAASASALGRGAVALVQGTKEANAEDNESEMNHSSNHSGQESPPPYSEIDAADSRFNYAVYVPKNRRA